MKNPQKLCRKFKDASPEELRARLAEFAKVRNWDEYHNPRNLLLALMISDSNGLMAGRGSGINTTAQEIYDVLMYLFQLADVCGLDLGQASLSKIVNNAPKYPILD
ncbi:unnamed protein product [Lactuca virosa]|uniref:Uncharacterized protein n=1 Tax=Lactuca virosa TaxID=75947 RepID=A0AAU9P177_9ASTR|nr:unnamed protein product [Lactuca virosa]